MCPSSITSFGIHKKGAISQLQLSNAFDQKQGSETILCVLCRHRSARKVLPTDGECYKLE